jgi:hypothetical protein
VTSLNSRGDSKRDVKQINISNLRDKKYMEISKLIFMSKILGCVGEEL